MAARRGFTSKQAPRTMAPGSFLPQEGVFISELIAAQLYWSTKFGVKDNDITAREDCELNLGLVFAVQDPDSDNDPMEDDAQGRYRHSEGFVRLHVDKDGNFGPGGGKAKAHKILAALLGQAFDPYDKDFDFTLYGPELEQYDDIFLVPHFQEYNKDEEWLKLTELIVNGTNLIGREAQLQFGYAEKPQGGRSERITIIGAMTMPKTGKKKVAAKANLKGGSPKKGEKADGDGGKMGEDAFTPEKKTTDAAPRLDASLLPQHIRWVVGRMVMEPMSVQEPHWLPFLQYFTEDGDSGPIEVLDDLDRLDAKKFKGLWEADEGEQLAEMYLTWRKELTSKAAKANTAAEPEPEEEDEFGDDNLPF